MKKTDFWGPKTSHDRAKLLAQKWPENQIVMLSIVLHGIIWYCMELLCILWYRIVLHVIALYRMVLHGIVSYGSAWYCIVGFGARAVSRKTPIYFIDN